MLLMQLGIGMTNFIRKPSVICKIFDFSAFGYDIFTTYKLIKGRNSIQNLNKQSKVSTNKAQIT